MCTCAKCGLNNCLCVCHRTKIVDEPKTRDEKEQDLIDHYSLELYDKDDEQIDQEYEDRIGSI